jgi:hypothetical protein
MLSADGARARIGGLGLCLLAASTLAGGCSKTGSYRVDWQFADTALPTKGPFQSGDCGRVGVGAIRITASSGGSDDVRAVPCGTGFYEGTLDPGSWTLTLVALDGAGQIKEQEPGTGNLTGTGLVEVQTGEMAPAIPPVFLPPLPQCRDGVDNDRDGRVDLDDADCRDANGPNRELDAECGVTDGASCHDNRPGEKKPST